MGNFFLYFVLFRLHVGLAIICMYMQSWSIQGWKDQRQRNSVKTLITFSICIYIGFSPLFWGLIFHCEWMRYGFLFQNSDFVSHISCFKVYVHIMYILAILQYSSSALLDSLFPLSFSFSFFFLFFVRSGVLQSLFLSFYLFVSIYFCRIFLLLSVNLFQLSLSLTLPCVSLFWSFFVCFFDTVSLSRSVSLLDCLYTYGTVSGYTATLLEKD